MQRIDNLQTKEYYYENHEESWHAVAEYLAHCLGSGRDYSGSLFQWSKYAPGDTRCRGRRFRPARPPDRLKDIKL